MLANLLQCLGPQRCGHFSPTRWLLQHMGKHNMANSLAWSHLRVGLALGVRFQQLLSHVVAESRCLCHLCLDGGSAWQQLAHPLQSEGHTQSGHRQDRCPDLRQVTSFGYVQSVSENKETEEGETVTNHTTSAQLRPSCFSEMHRKVQKWIEIVAFPLPGRQGKTANGIRSALA